MAAPQELILSASSSFASPSTSNAHAKRATFAPIINVPAASNSNGGSHASFISLHDLTTSSHVHTFKPSGGTSLYGLANAKSRNGSGGLLFASQEGKALLHVWAWQKDQLHLKLHLPEKLSCFEVSPNGVWAAGGTHSGHVYLWEIASGLLMASFDAAYRKINVIKFDGSSAVMVCGSEDSSLGVWSVARLVDNALSATIPQPLASLTHHTLAVTSIQISHAPFPHCRIFSTSLDGTFKVFSLSPPTLLTSFVLPAGQIPTCMVVDPMERYVYLGTNNGEVHLVPLFRRRKEMGIATEEEHGGDDDRRAAVSSDIVAELGNQVVAVGGAGLNAQPIAIAGEVLSSGGKSTGKGKITLGSPITAMALSISQTHLITGTSVGDIHLHALPSHTLLRTISTHGGTPVTHLSTMLRPPDLVGHMNFASLSGAGTGSSSKTEEWPIIECKPFERMRVGRKERDLQEVTILLGPFDGEEEELDCLDTTTLLTASENGSSAIGYSGGVVGGTSGSDTRKAEDRANLLEVELAKAKRQLGRAKEINDAMWNGVVRKAMQTDGGPDASEGDFVRAGVELDHSEEGLIMID